MSLRLLGIALRTVTSSPSSRTLWVTAVVRTSTKVAESTVSRANKRTILSSHSFQNHWYVTSIKTFYLAHSRNTLCLIDFVVSVKGR